MKYFSFLIVFLSITFQAFSSNDTIQIEKVYDELNLQIQNENYEECVKLFDQESIEYFNNITKNIYSGNKDTLFQQSPIDIIMIIMIKKEMLKKGIPDFSLNNALIFSLKAGRQDISPKKSLTNINISDNWATATQVLGDKETDKIIYFKKTNGEWKLNLTHEMTYSKINNENILKKFDHSIEKLVDYLLQQSGMDSTLFFQPMKP